MRAFVQGLSVLASARQPGDDGGLPVAEDPLGGGRVQPFGECRQHHCDLLRGRFQTVQGGMASGTESGAAGLTTKRLDPLSMAMLTISNQGMNVSVCDVRVGALLVRTGETLRVHPLGCASAAFHLTPGADRRRRRPHSRRVGAGEATGGAIVWRAWLEEALERGTPGCCCRLGTTMMGPAKGTQPHEREHEDEHKQEQEHMQRHRDLRRLKLRS
jgi:hypothetical protein